MELPRYIKSLKGEEYSARNKRRNLILSVSYLLLGILWLFRGTMTPFFLYFMGMGLFGLFGVSLYSRNIHPGITFNNGSILLTSSFFKEKAINVSQLQKVELHLSKIILKLKENKEETVELSGYSYSSVKQLKESFQEYTNEYKIECTII